MLLNKELIDINQDVPDAAGVFHPAQRVGFDTGCCPPGEQGAGPLKRTRARARGGGKGGRRGS